MVLKKLSDGQKKFNYNYLIFMRIHKRLLLCMIFLFLFCKSDQQTFEKTPQPTKHTLLNQYTIPKWEVTNFSGSGTVKLSDSVITIGAGNDLTGINWTGHFPKKNYELSLQAKRLEGDDFFCGLTFPVRGTYCSLIVGGWGGMVVGISNVDWNDASENITTTNMAFKNDVWYLIHLKVTGEKIQVWIDHNLLIDLRHSDHQLSLHPFMKPSTPFGLTTWKTKARIRNIILKENIN